MFEILHKDNVKVNKILFFTVDALLLIKRNLEENVFIHYIPPNNIL